jgi:hypothetical protein
MGNLTSQELAHIEDPIGLDSTELLLAKLTQATLNNSGGGGEGGSESVLTATKHLLFGVNAPPYAAVNVTGIVFAGTPTAAVGGQIVTDTAIPITNGLFGTGESLVSVFSAMFPSGEGYTIDFARVNDIDWIYIFHEEDGSWYANQLISTGGAVVHEFVPETSGGNTTLATLVQNAAVGSVTIPDGIYLVENRVLINKYGIGTEYLISGLLPTLQPIQHKRQTATIAAGPGTVQCVIIYSDGEVS